VRDNWYNTFVSGDTIGVQTGPSFLNRSQLQIMKKVFSNKYAKSVFTFLIILIVCFLFLKIYHYLDYYLPAPDTESQDPEFNDAEKFIKYGYPEIKSLSIQFLTLLTAILIFSLTFSEKIINYNQAKHSIRILIISGWTLLILAIISDGVGLAYNAIALPTALVDLNDFEKTHSTRSGFYEPAYYSLKAILMSGVFFISGLICIVTAGIASLIHQSKLQ
jgi:hypothetical protein